MLGRVRSGRGDGPTRASAKMEGEDVREGVRRVSSVTSFILLRRKGWSRSKAEKRPEVERGGIQKWRLEQLHFRWNDTEELDGKNVERMMAVFQEHGYC